MLSTRFKESFKTALAMTIAYGIALSMDWDRPYWAGFVVAFISLATIGQSLNKAAMRMLGTLVAMAIALTLIALFAQERWAFMLILSIFLGFMAYMMGASRSPYFWQVTGFVTVIICMDGGLDPANAFDTAVLRAQETGLGILVYSLVAVLLWPSSSRADFDAAATDQASTQHQLYRAYLQLMQGQGGEEKAQPLRAQEIQLQTRFGQLLDAAVAEDYEVWELRRQWRHYQHLSADLTETMQRWRESFAEVQTLDLHLLLPDLTAYGDELERRLAQVDRVLAGETPQSAPQALEMPLDRDAVKQLSHFHKAAVEVTRSRLQHLERLTRSLFEAACDIKGVGKAVAPTDEARTPSTFFLPDPDRLANAVRLLAIMWMAYLAMIYVPAMPGGAGFVSMAGALGIALATMPQVPITMLILPSAGSVLFAGLLYIFVMPQLSSFTGLGLMIFAVTFAICYLFAAPRQGLSRAFGLAMFIVIISVSNQQTYNFLTVANTAMMFPLVFVIFAIAAYIPFSTRPEAYFLRLLSRFFRSAEYLMSTMNWELGHKLSGFDRWKKAYHVHQLNTLPQKIGGWAAHVDTKVLPGTTPEQIQALVTSLQALSYRMQGLLEARSSPQADLLVQELLADFRDWRLRVQVAFQGLSDDPAAAEQEAFRKRLSQIMEHMEQRIEATMDKAAEGQLSEQDAENFYRLLGAYRGVSEATIDYAGTACVIDWGGWREARF